jgi:hypothetical protein
LAVLPGVTRNSHAVALRWLTLWGKSSAIGDEREKSLIGEPTDQSWNSTK